MREVKMLERMEAHGIFQVLSEGMGDTLCYVSY